MHNIGLHCCSKFQKNLTKFRGIMAKKFTKKHSKMVIFGWLENIWKLITFQPQMPHRWNLRGLSIFMSLSLGRHPWGVGGRGRKTSENELKIEFFWLISWIFKAISKTLIHGMCYLTLHHWEKFQRNLTAFGGATARKPPRSSLQMSFLLRKHLKIHNMATTNATQMKLTTIMYLHEIFHVAKN